MAGMYALDDYVKSGGDVRAEAPTLERLMTDVARESIDDYLAMTDQKRASPLTADETAWLPASLQPPTERILVIHGTWPKGGWWLPGSPFVTYLDSVTSRAVYKEKDQFQWSGANSHSDRVQAGEVLVRWLNCHPNIDTIIAHSHGGTLVFIASRILATGTKPIGKVINLGTPARTDYPPDLRGITLLRNVYSFGDLVQTPVATAPHPRGEGRSVSDSGSSLNVVVDGPKGRVGHSDLHSESVWRHNKLDQYL